MAAPNTLKARFKGPHHNLRGWPGRFVVLTINVHPDVLQPDAAVGVVDGLVPGEFDRTDETWSIPAEHLLDLGLGADQVRLEPFKPSGFLSPSTSYAGVATRLVWSAWSSPPPV